MTSRFLLAIWATDSALGVPKARPFPQIIFRLVVTG